QSVLGIAQMLILAKLYPLPKISEEEYRLAEIQYGVASPKKKKKKPAGELSDGSEPELIETELLDSTKNKNENGDGEENKETAEEDKKYISKTIPQGVNPQIKNNYQKTGKKYTVKRRNKDK
ncbi:MAG: hypothetical protein FWD71_20445, partial [Oscillospiraceae bacterium]|nr:hypothetical protein [Oscillospiraceae bacterium]